ncbi:MAG: class I SAM-dependent methyltransferase [Phycisphaeraceae bacterium]
MTEKLSPRRPATRVPEPAMVMDEADQVDEYLAAGVDDGAMTATHLLHSAHAAALIRPGDRVLDLGCGPGTQLIQLAELCPDAEFVGVDLSPRMLALAEANAAASGTTNVRWRQADITALDAFDDSSFGVITSSMTLHHLPTMADLRRCLEQVHRLLDADGRVYLADFARLRSVAAMRALSRMRADHQPTLFTRDYFNSLRAAFSARQWHEAAEASGLLERDDVRLDVTQPIGLMQVLRSEAADPIDAQLAARLEARQAVLGARAREDLAALTQLFDRGGLRPILS